MGIFKWLMNSGKGSIEESVKVFLNRYNYFLNEDNDKNEALKTVYLERAMVSKQLGAYGQSYFRNYSDELLIKVSKGNLPIAIFLILLIETNQFRKSCYESTGYLKLSCEIIFDTVKKVMPTEIAGQKQNFVEDAINEFNDFFKPLIKMDSVFW